MVVTVVTVRVDTDEGKVERRVVLQKDSPCDFPSTHQAEKYQEWPC